MLILIVYRSTSIILKPPALEQKDIDCTFTQAGKDVDDKRARMVIWFYTERNEACHAEESQYRPRLASTGHSSLCLGSNSYADNVETYILCPGNSSVSVKP
jgi:hypothetical protein